jgi:hypothetical protein
VAADLSAVADGAGDADERLDELIHRADLDGLVRLVDDRTAAGDWAGLLRARARARAAVGTGRELWPVATLAEYRLALVAPASWAARVISEESGMFTIGPLTEVIAQHHTWSDLAPLVTGPQASVIAHERVLRGETLDPTTLAPLPNVLDLPYVLAPWEPAYADVSYSDAGVDAPAPVLPVTTADGDGDRAGEIDVIEDPATELAVRQLVEEWTARSNGRAEVRSVAGTAATAVRALGVRRAMLGPMALGSALA